MQDCITKQHICTTWKTGFWGEDPDPEKRDLIGPWCCASEAIKISERNADVSQWRLCVLRPSLLGWTRCYLQLHIEIDQMFQCTAIKIRPCHFNNDDLEMYQNVNLICFELFWPLCQMAQIYRNTVIQSLILITVVIYPLKDWSNWWLWLLLGRFLLEIVLFFILTGFDVEINLKMIL